MRAIEGQITLVQESRFQVTDLDGVSHLFLLSPHAAAEPGQLVPLAARQARVRVSYSDSDNEIALVAERVEFDETPGQGGRS